MKSFTFKTEWMDILSTLELTDQAIAFNAILHFAKTGEEIAEGVIKETISPILESLKIQDQRRILRNQKARARRLAKRSETEIAKNSVHPEITPMLIQSADKPSFKQHSGNFVTDVPGLKFKYVERNSKTSRRRHKKR